MHENKLGQRGNLQKILQKIIEIKGIKQARQKIAAFDDILTFDDRYDFSSYSMLKCGVLYIPCNTVKTPDINPVKFRNS